VTEADIVKLDEVWPEGQRDVGMMLHQAPEPILRILVEHPWDSVTLRETIEAEQRLREAYDRVRSGT
jgi:hypothetical protein